MGKISLREVEVEVKAMQVMECVCVCVCAKSIMGKIMKREETEKSSGIVAQGR